MEQVFLLWHSHGECGRCGEEDSKLLGVYSSRNQAERRRLEAASLPGFRRFPDAFVIDLYQVDVDMWTTGFASASADGGWESDPAP